MTTISIFRERLTGAINEFSEDILAPFTDRDRQTDFLARLAKVLEASHQIAMRTLSDLVADDFPDIANALRENLGAIDDDAEQYAETELGFALYWLQTDRDRLLSGPGVAPEITLSFNLLSSVLPASAINGGNITALFSSTETDARRRVWVGDDGTVFGTAQYEQLDIGWTKAVTNLISTIWHNDFVKPFPTRKKFSTIPLKPNADGNVKIAIIGDWGGGNALAQDVMETVCKLEPDYIIHLGDVYYAGTDKKGSPPNEEQDFLIDFWKKYGPAKTGCCFTLNSNHEMYSGARGYFNVALPDPMFANQGPYSYFALEFGDWVIAGFDSAYYASSLTFFLSGGMGGDKDPQYGFLKNVAGLCKKTILMSHHNPISYNGGKNGRMWGQSKFWKEIAKVITPDYWYWGHIHLAAVYNQSAAANPIKARCVGHSCIPFGTPRGLVNNSKADWFSNTPFDDPEERVYPKGATRTKNGFAMMTLTTDGITEEFFHAGSTTPVHTV